MKIYNFYDNFVNKMYIIFILLYENQFIGISRTFRQYQYDAVAPASHQSKRAFNASQRRLMSPVEHLLPSAIPQHDTIDAKVVRFLYLSHTTRWFHRWPVLKSQHEHRTECYKRIASCVLNELRRRCVHLHGVQTATRADRRLYNEVDSVHAGKSETGNVLWCNNTKTHMFT